MDTVSGAVRGVLVLGTVCFVGGARVPDALALRCNSRLVSKGDRPGQVRAICGEPAEVDRYVVERSEQLTLPYSYARRYRRAGQASLLYYRKASPSSRGRTGYRRRLAAGALGPADGYYSQRVSKPDLIEEWTYNFGRHRLMVTVRFRNGRVQSEETLGYGYDEKPARPLARKDLPAR